MAEALLQNIYLEERKNIWKNRLKCVLCICKPNFEETKALDVASDLLVAFNKVILLVLQKIYRFKDMVEIWQKTFTGEKLLRIIIFVKLENLNVTLFIKLT